MIALLIALTILASASAFAPIASMAPGTALRMDFANGLSGNAGPELKNFDPLKFSEKSPEWVPWFREAELKHGRVCMLATLGYVFADFIKLPGDVHQVSSFEAHNAAIQSGAMIQILIWSGLIELISIPSLRNMGETGRAPGDYSFDPLKLGQGAKLEKYRVNELKNGRLAMMAFSGIVTQDALGHHGFPYF